MDWISAKIDVIKYEKDLKTKLKKYFRKIFKFCQRR